MDRGVTGAQPLASGLPALIALVGFVMVGCTETHPEPNVELGGVLDSRTHEADSMRRIEERQEQNRGGGVSGGGEGGGGY